jgi:hypothetical protein
MSKANGPDYSTVTSHAEAQQLAEKGELVSVLLLPEIFGGKAVAANVVFVPPFAAVLKKRVDEEIVRPLAAEGKVTQYASEPRYEGESFVPVSITVRAHNPGTFSETIGIWGEGRELDRQQCDGQD